MSELDNIGVRRGHAILKDAPPTTLAKFEAALEESDDLELDACGEETYLIYELGVSEDDEEDDE